MEIKHTIHKSAHFGKLRFSVREDYVNYFLEKKAINTEEELWDNPKFVSIIHRHWHGEGRNGCIFALLAARRADEFGWSDYVISQKVDEVESGVVAKQIIDRIGQAIADPQCEILSLLFSNITTDEELARLIKYLATLKGFILTDIEDHGDLVTMAMRIPITADNALSWLMAFGPYDYFPKTRQSPIMEIAIRVKPKPKEQFHLLSKDHDAAHLADLPVDYKIEMMEKTWEHTLERTRMILGEEPDHFSAAKTTFTLPKEVWEKTGS